MSIRPVPARPVRLVLTGMPGEHFTGRYVADGTTNSVQATLPAEINFLARNVAYEFTREGGEREFRVALYVDGLCRLSTTSGQHLGVQGQLKYSRNEESCWAGGF